jgi:hypothetical protein
MGEKVAQNTGTFLPKLIDGMVIFSRRNLVKIA